VLVGLVTVQVSSVRDEISIYDFCRHILVKRTKEHYEID
jgi:hypothetical protein